MTNILYITYNGLLDHIGTAQVLPYLLPAARSGHRITLVSFEKADRFTHRAELEARLLDHGIDWYPQRFHTGLPFLAKLKDLWSLRGITRRLCREKRFDLVHCRSYIPAAAGLKLKRRHGIPLLFDMRGLWVDQRREGGRWRRSNPLYRLLYWQWKRKEAAIVSGADEIVTLTEACADEVRSWGAYTGARITVCPCCVDTGLFAPRESTTRTTIREELGVSAVAPLLVYLGSVGSVYYLEESLKFFAALHAHNPAARFLFLGFHERSMLMHAVEAAGLDLPEEVFITRALEREDVPDYLAAADAGLCFIMPGYSSIGVSPTKLGEFLACGLPVYGNRGVGDVASLALRLKGLVVLEDFSSDRLRDVTAEFTPPSAGDRQAIAEAARPLLDIEVALANYESIYRDYPVGGAHG